MIGLVVVVLQVNLLAGVSIALAAKAASAAS